MARRAPRLHPDPVDDVDAEDEIPRAARPRPSASAGPWRGWRPVTWLLVAGAALVEHAVGLLVWAYVSLQYAGVCNEPASAGDLQHGQRALVVATVIAATPWAVALTRARHRLRIALFAGAAVAPVAFGMVQALLSSPSEWTSGWCVF